MRHLRISHDYVTTRDQLQVKGKLPSPCFREPNFPSSGYKKALPEGWGLAFLKGQTPSPFPSNKFSSLCLNTWLILFFSALALKMLSFLTFYLLEPQLKPLEIYCLVTPYPKPTPFYHFRQNVKTSHSIIFKFS